MRILTTVKDMMSFIEDGDSKWVTLITACSNEEIYSNWYFNFPYEMRESDITSIKLDGADHIILYIL